MRMSIRLRTILALDAFVVGLALVFGWIAQDVAGRVVEERFVKEMVASASAFLKTKRFPQSDAMMTYLHELFNAEWITWRDQPPGVVGSSLPKALTAAFQQRLSTASSVGTLTLGDRIYRVDSADILTEDSASGRQIPGRLFMLVPDAQFQEARQRARASVGRVIWPAAAASTLLAIWLSVSMTRPIRKLACEMDRLATAEGSNVQPDPAVARRGPTEILALASSFHRLLDRLGAARQRMAQSEQLATLGKVCLSVAHELRNPLSGIKMNIRVLEDRPDLKHDPGIQAILREIERMGLYLDELMNFAPGANKAARTSAPVAIRLSELADSVLTILAGRCRHANVSIRRDYPTYEPEILADANPLRQTMMNLMMNALEAMPSGGTMSVSIRVLDDSIRFSVADTGKGVDAHDKDLFAAFVTDKPNGVGLGLYICKQVVSAHAGQIGYDSTPAGATFWFDLPRPATLASDGDPAYTTASEGNV